MTNRCGNNGNSEKLYFGGYKITADGDYSHEIKRLLLLGRKASILQGSAFFMVQLSHPYVTAGKTVALTIQTFVGKMIISTF